MLFHATRRCTPGTSFLLCLQRVLRRRGQSEDSSELERAQSRSRASGRPAFAWGPWPLPFCGPRALFSTPDKLRNPPGCREIWWGGGGDAEGRNLKSAALRAALNQPQPSATWSITVSPSRGQARAVTPSEGRGNAPAAKKPLAPGRTASGRQKQDKNSVLRALNPKLMGRPGTARNGSSLDKIKLGYASRMGPWRRNQKTVAERLNCQILSADLVRRSRLLFQLCMSTDKIEKQI